MAKQIRQATIASAVYSTTAMPAKTGAIAMTATTPNGVALAGTFGVGIGWRGKGGIP